MANKGENSVTRLDPATGEPVGNPIAVGDTPKEIAVGLGAAWVVNSEPPPSAASTRKQGR